MPAAPSNRFAFTQAARLIDNPVAEKGLRVLLYPEGRWAVRSAKTTQLLYSVLAKEAAREAGVDDAWFVQDGLITEQTSANAHIIDARGVLVSHPVDHGVLPGVTRICALQIARDMGLAIEERPFRRTNYLPRARLSSPPPGRSSCPWWRWTDGPSAARTGPELLRKSAAATSPCCALDRPFS